MRLLVATTNPGKLREICDILAGAPVVIDDLTRHPGIDEAPEDGETFADNARQKARYYAERTGQLTVAEDSGLSVAALDGAPGVRSARFNGSSYPEKFTALWQLIAARERPTRDAQFVCALAVADGARIVFEAEGTIEGHLVREPRGEHGFGYDPIFFYPPFGCTLAEVLPARKAEVSHRGQAFRKLREFLDQQPAADR